MRTALPTERCPAASESLCLKSALVASVLVLASFLVVAQEFYFSASARSLSETEAALRLAAASPLTREDTPSAARAPTENR